MQKETIRRWINEKYLNPKEAAKIRKRFEKSMPFANFMLPDFFRREGILKLRRELLRENFTAVDKDLFSFRHTKDLRYSKCEVINEFCSLFSSPGFIALMKSLTGKKLSGKIDMQSHKLLQGDYLLMHDDLTGRRSIAYIVYLSSLEVKDGGRLRLYEAKNPMHPAKFIQPKFNSFACFKVSNKSLHDVEEVKSAKERLTIGGWFYGN